MPRQQRELGLPHATNTPINPDTFVCAVHCVCVLRVVRRREDRESGIRVYAPAAARVCMGLHWLVHAADVKKHLKLMLLALKHYLEVVRV